MDKGAQIDYLNAFILEIQKGLPGILPEIIISIGILLMLVLSLLPRLKGIFSEITFAIIIIIGLGAIGYIHPNKQTYYFNGTIFSSGVMLFLKVSCYLGILLTHIMDLRKEHSRVKHGNEKKALYLTLLLGASFMVMSNHYLLTFIAIELVSIASYILVAFEDKKIGFEGALKYLLFGAFSTAILLYGLSFIYGLTGTFYYENLSVYDGNLLLFAGIFFSLGLLFKLGAVPMHLWLPDVYESSSPSLVALLSTVPKLAIVGLVWIWLDATELLSTSWMPALLAASALLSIVLGTTAAIWQSQPKRLMAYSSIAHTGFFLMGILCFEYNGLLAILFFGFIYLLMNFLSLFFIQLMEEQGIHQINQYNGIFKKLPFMSVLFVLAMISLTGLPPTAGFTGKFLLFLGLLEGPGDALRYALLGIGLLATVVSLFFYLKMPYQMIFKTSEAAVKKTGTVDKILATILALPLFLLFIKSDFLLNFIDHLIYAP